MTHNFADHIKGDTWQKNTLIFEVKINSVVQDITAYVIRMQLRPKPGSSTISLDLTPSLELHDPVNGKFRINPVIIDIPAREYYYDIEFANGTVINTWVSGTLTVVNDVTR